ncbi:hypothetical protein MPTK1_2g07780 [Marchantia polymorpha subsp. ruderalis]|uniref:Uncharacterized protein n=1 Tax=Marchantia polymorpha TaxID=3197 RepID=A0A2R6XGM2_MARPO|nr:hypothetical protein MARPO_0015s0064 [Marchantia polymorpha]BBN01489.1 hypothetical protein Mp_2g07780 [Marchantia polymorpha subsp. ruderalis]|eukprot:PTQ45256.1 hypothetical protein MARPO_0015s0064 [Marchantia polymorpha]
MCTEIHVRNVMGSLDSCDAPLTDDSIFEDRTTYDLLLRAKCLSPQLPACLTASSHLSLSTASLGLLPLLPDIIVLCSYTRFLSGLYVVLTPQISNLIPHSLPLCFFSYSPVDITI